MPLFDNNEENNISSPNLDLAVNPTGAMSDADDHHRDNDDLVSDETSEAQENGLGSGGNEINNTGGVEEDTAAFVGNTMFDVQDRIFHAMFYRVAIFYIRNVPRPLRIAHEYLLLLGGVTSLAMIIYLRVGLHRKSLDPQNECCLVNLKELWPENGIVNVNLLYDRPAKPPYFRPLPKAQSRVVATDCSLRSLDTMGHINTPPPLTCPCQDISNLSTVLPTANRKGFVRRIIDSVKSHLELATHFEQYTMELSHDYGMLRLSPKLREHFSIPTLVFEVEANDSKCFGNSISRFVLREFLGYQEIMIANINFAVEGNQGYARNLITGESFRFVTSNPTRLTFAGAFVIMTMFTLSISILLRYSHNQIFFLIVDILHMFEMNIVLGSPVAPLLTAILALIGIETIMSEFFGDSSAAFCMIILVWMADQFYAVCCRTAVSEKYWIRFFYLYQFAFYAHHIRYRGQYCGLALFSVFCFVLHSMLFFFNNYEIPNIVQNGPGGGGQHQGQHAFGNSIGIQITLIEQSNM